MRLIALQRSLICGVGTVLMLCSRQMDVSAAEDFEREPIKYSETAPSNAITRLQQQLDSGDIQFEFRDDRGYLDSVLKALQISPRSQMLVYSKTSLQIARIRPRAPRALYFNEDLYIGYCQMGDVMEVSVADPQLGTVFYTLDQHESEKPKFVRQTDNCLICHASSRTDNVPGHLIRSLYVDAGGQPKFSAGSYIVDQTTEWEKRWGGWYVTGTHGGMTHLGNLVIRSQDVPREVDNSAGQNLTDLQGLFQTNHYMTPHSDLVALSVLAHQVKGHNLITRANFTTRDALHYQKTLNEELGEKPEHRWESTDRRIKSVSEELLEYLLFSGETSLTAPIAGTSGFAEEFSQRGPFDDRGRSLHQLDLQTRLLKYPCSYLIYTDSFAALPEEVLIRLGKRMREILTGEDQSEPWQHLSAEDRQAILLILLGTRDALPRAFLDSLSPASAAVSN